ncbi:flippase [Halopelagius longus]|uniref:Flippase n=1 Tax=Halopelagius longus TaxID=1236180 RepID=A0A1H1GJ37_9EURY|nr:flippase [Halopelagius longus]RDI69748.1 flippase [Halopelagius longus]SDR13242.1 Membrane protein involved in the export of O-antigen and teichoic acid [Halopelagius longus]
MSRSIVKGFLSIFSGKMLTSVISIVALPFVVRVLGPDGYGDYAFLLSVFSVMMIFFSSGVTEGVQKFAAEERDFEEWRSNVVGFYLKLATGLAALGVVCVVGVTRLGIVERQLGARFDLYFYLLAALVVAAQYRAFARRTLMGFGLEEYSEPLRVVGKILLFGTGLGLGYFFGFGVEGFLLGNILGDAVVAVIGLWIILNRVSIREVVSRTAESVSRNELLTFNVLNIALVLLVMSLYHTDIIMMRMFLGSEETGYYRAALSIAEYIWFVPIALQALLLHSASTLWSNEEYARISSLTTRIIRYTALLAVVMSIGVAVLADRFVPYYYGADFVPMIRPLLFLLPGVVGFALARPIYAVSQGNGDLKPIIVATSGSAALNLVLNYLLIPRFGMIGAATATSIGYGSMLLMHVGCARHLGYYPLKDFRAPRILAAGAIAAPVIYAADWVLASDMAALAVVPVVGFVVYAVASLAVGAVSVEEVLNVLSYFPSPIDNWSQSVQQWRQE